MTKAGAFLNEAIADLDAPHVFTVHRIKETTAKFVAVRANLGIVTKEVMTGLARKRCATARVLFCARSLSGFCKMGLEGIVSKRLGSRYRSGRSPDWLKFKNPRRRR